VEIEISALGIGREEGGVLLSGHAEVLIDLSTFSKFQFQHLLFRRIANAGDTAGIYRNTLHAFLDAHAPTAAPKISKSKSRPQAGYWRSHKMVAEVDRFRAIVEDYSQLEVIAGSIRQLSDPSEVTRIHGSAGLDFDTD
jgi:hypothetical protein